MEHSRAYFISEKNEILSLHGNWSWDRLYCKPVFYRVEGALPSALTQLAEGGNEPTTALITIGRRLYLLYYQILWKAGYKTRFYLVLWNTKLISPPTAGMNKYLYTILNWMTAVIWYLEPLKNYHWINIWHYTDSDI